MDALVAHLAAFPAVQQEVPVRDTGHRLSSDVVKQVLTTEAGRPIRRSSFSAIWRAGVEAAVAEGTTFHDLWHFYASLLILSATARALRSFRPGLDTHRQLRRWTHTPTSGLMPRTAPGTPSMRCWGRATRGHPVARADVSGQLHLVLRDPQAMELLVALRRENSPRVRGILLCPHYHRIASARRTRP